MPPEPHINGWTQITVWWSDTSGAHSNVFSYKSSTQPSPLEMQNIAQAFWTQCGTSFRAILAAAHNVDRIEARTRWVGVNYLGTYYPTQPQPGTSTGDPVPNNVAAVISWKSGARGRQYQGRTFMGGLSESIVTMDTLQSALLTALNVLANNIGTFTNSGGTPMSFVIASVRYLLLTTVLRSFMDNIADSQRRRLQGRGQ